MNTHTILTGSDRMNSVLWRSDAPQNISYTSYGSVDNATPGDIGFNGERRDPVSGSTHLGNGCRAYSPALMRFTCPDSLSPFGAGGINPYAYCSGDPMNHADPSGHMSTGQGVAMGLGILAGILLSVVTAGASLAVALSVEVVGGIVIGASSELAAEGIDHQKVNWGAVGISAGMGAAMSLVGFGLGRAASKGIRRWGTGYFQRGGGISGEDLPMIMMNSRTTEEEVSVTRDIMGKYRITDDFLAVRITDNKFIDFERCSIQGHQNTLANVHDWYNPSDDLGLGIMRGTLRHSADIAKEEGRNALNVFLMSKDDFSTEILNKGVGGHMFSGYGGSAQKSWVTSPLRKLLDLGGKLYPDATSALRVGRTGYPFIITHPLSSRLPVDIYPHIVVAH